MVTLLLFLLLLSPGLLSSAAPGQSTGHPHTARIVGNCYENEFFKMRYEFPEGWRVRWVGGRGEQPDRETGRAVYELLLLQNRDFPTPAGQVHITAVDVSRSPLTGAERALPDELPRERNPDLKRRRGPRQVTIAGREYTRTDFEMRWRRVTVLYETKLATDVGEYIVVFTLVASDRDLFDQLLRTMEKVSLGTVGTCA